LTARSNGRSKFFKSDFPLRTGASFVYDRSIGAWVQRLLGIVAGWQTFNVGA
jgi:hypothetical protein